MCWTDVVFGCLAAVWQCVVKPCTPCVQRLSADDWDAAVEWAQDRLSRLARIMLPTREAYTGALRSSSGSMDWATAGVQLAPHRAADLTPHARRPQVRLLWLGCTAWSRHDMRATPPQGPWVYLVVVPGTDPTPTTSSLHACLRPSSHGR